MKYPLFINAYAARSATEDPLQKFKFRVSFPDLSIPATIGFQTVKGLSREIEVVEYDESGFDYTHKLPGKASVGEVTLTRGIFADPSLYEQAMITLQNPQFRTTCKIELMDRFGNVQRTWTLAEAWFASWELEDLDAASDDVAIESCVLQFEYFL